MLVILSLYQKDIRFRQRRDWTGHKLSYLDALSGRDLKVILRIFNCTHSVVFPLKANQDTFHVGDIRCCVCKACRAVPTMRRGQDLYVVLVRGSQNHLPEITLYGMVNAVLCFVDDQEPVSAVGESQGYAEQTRRSVAQALQRNGLIVALDLCDGPSTIRTATSSVIPDHCYTFHLVIKDQIQRVYCVGLVIGKRYLIPEPCQVNVAQQARP